MRASNGAVRLWMLLALAGLSGCTGDGGGDGGTARLITVSGQAFINGQVPLASQGVRVGTQSGFTDQNGRFTFSGVATPYEADIIAGTAAAAYVGLTRPDPVLNLPVGAGGGSSTAWVEGPIGGGLPDGTLGTITGVAFGSPTSPTAGFQSVATGGQYMFPVSWQGSTTLTGGVHALQWQSDGGPWADLRFTGIASQSDVVLSNGATVTIPLVMATPSGGAASVTATVPAGYTMTLANLGVQFDDGTVFGVDSKPGASTFDLFVPALTGGAASLTLAADGPPPAQSTGTVTQLVPGSQLELDFPAAPELLTPADGAVGVDQQTELSWTPLDGGVSLLTASCQGVGTSAPSTIFVFTAANTAHLISNLGFPFYPSQCLVYWSVEVVAPVPSIDALAGSTAFESQATERFHVYSARRSFTLR